MGKAEDQSRKLGELLVAAGLLSADRLDEGLQYAEEHRLPLGRVLITLKLLSEEDLESVLHSQALMKIDKLSASTAARAIAMASANNLSIDKALKKLGWFPDKITSRETLAVSIALEQLKNAEISFGAQHPELAASCIKLAELLCDYARYEESEKLYRRSQEIIEGCFGSKSIELANLFSKLAALYFVQDKFTEAEKYYWLAYEIKQELLGANDLSVAKCLEDLAELYDVQSEYLQAERFYLTSIGIKEQHLEPDHPELIQSLRKLVLVCRQNEYNPESASEPKHTGDLLVDAGMVQREKVEEGLKLAHKYKIPIGRALVSLRQLSQEDLQRVMHSQVLMRDARVPAYLVTRALKAACRLNCTVAQALAKIGWRKEHPADQKQLELLLRCSDELIKIEQTKTPEHPEVAAKCTELAELYSGADNLREAEILLNRALNIYEQGKGEREIDLASIFAMAQLSQVHCRQGRFDDSEKLISKSLDFAKSLNENSSEKDQYDISELLDIKAKILHASNKNEKAVEVLAELLTIKTKVLGAESALLAAIYELRADCFVELTKYDEAVENFKKALAIKEKTLSSGNPQICGLWSKIGTVQMKEEKFSDALQSFQKAQSLSASLLGANHPMVALAEIRLADCYAAMSDYPKASKSFESAIKIMEESVGSVHDDTAHVLEQYSAYLKKIGLREESAKVDKRISDIRSKSGMRQTSIQLKMFSS